MQERLQQYSRRVAAAVRDHETATKNRSMAVDIGAANRFIEHAIPELTEEQKRKLRKVRKYLVFASLLAEPSITRALCFFHRDGAKQAGKEAEKDHNETSKSGKKIKAKKRSASEDGAEDRRCCSAFLLGTNTAFAAETSPLCLKSIVACLCVVHRSPNPATRAKNADEFLSSVLGSADATPSKKSKKKNKKGGS
jgi:hypothetical protein